MGQKPVITVDDITNIAFEERRPGCEKGVLQEDAPSQTSVIPRPAGQRRADAPAFAGLRSFRRREGGT